MRIKFSIIIATYNRDYVLWKAIQSVQKQIYPYWQLLVVDDGSTDNTHQVVAEFQKDPRIEYLKIAHAGCPAAKNYGLSQAQGEPITYVDSDDYMYENCFSTALEYFNREPQKVFATSNYNRRIELYDKNYRLVDFVRASSAQKLAVSLQDFYHWKVKTCGTGIFHKQSVKNSKIRWDTNIRMLDDLDFILQLGHHYLDGYMHIPYVLFEYLQKYGGDSICSNTSYDEQAEAFKKIYENIRVTHL